MIRYVFLTIALLLVAGCGALPTGDHPSIDNSQVGSIPPAAAQPSGTDIQKVSVPVDVDLTIETQNLAVGRDLPLSLRFKPWQAVQHAQSRIEASGVVTVTSPTSRSWNNLAAQQELKTQTTFRIVGMGAGTLKGEVQVLDTSGTALYGRTATIYVLATDQGVLTGTSGPAQLQREYLERARAAGALTQQEYEKALDKLRYGGAAETTIIVVPTPLP